MLWLEKSKIDSGSLTYLKQLDRSRDRIRVAFVNYLPECDADVNLWRRFIICRFFRVTEYIIAME